MQFKQITGRLAGILNEMESDGQGSLHHNRIAELIYELQNITVERTLMLQRFVGMAQERVWPCLETINEARVLLGMEELNELSSV